jgi:hypothetical protein
MRGRVASEFATAISGRAQKGISYP